MFVHVRTPTTGHLVTVAAIGLFEALFYLVGDAVSKEYGLWGGFLLIFSINALIALLIVTEPGSNQQ